MYSFEERMRAVELYIQYDRSSATTIRELGYPSRKGLYRWYREFRQAGCLHDGYRTKPRYVTEQKERAVGYYLEHGRSISGTLRALGYPSRSLLVIWIDELRPGLRKVPIRAGSAVPFSEEEKRRAVIALCSRDGSAESVARSVGVSRQILYAWKRELLEEGAPCKPLKNLARSGLRLHSPRRGGTSLPPPKTDHGRAVECRRNRGKASYEPEKEE